MDSKERMLVYLSFILALQLMVIFYMEVISYKRWSQLMMAYERINYIDTSSYFYDYEPVETLNSKNTSNIV